MRKRMRLLCARAGCLGDDNASDKTHPTHVLEGTITIYPIRERLPASFPDEEQNDYNKVRSFPFSRC